MADKKWDEALSSLTQKLDDLSERARETAECARYRLKERAADVKSAATAAEVRAEDAAERGREKVSGALLASKLDLDERIKSAQGDLAAAQERCREITERGEEKVSAELLKAQMNFEALRDRLREKKDAQDAKHLESYIDKQLEHALRCYAHAAVLIEDARLSVLEAVAGAAEYEEKYGES